MKLRTIKELNNGRFKDIDLMFSESFLWCCLYFIISGVIFGIIIDILTPNILNPWIAGVIAILGILINLKIQEKIFLYLALCESYIGDKNEI